MRLRGARVPAAATIDAIIVIIRDKKEGKCECVCVF